MVKKIFVEEIDGVVVPESFRSRFYDRRKHRGHIKICACGTKFYDETPRITATLCLECRVLDISSNHDILPIKAINNPRRHKCCNLCGSEYLDTSLACSRKYCSLCSAKYSYDILEKLIREQGTHPNATSYEYLSDALNLVKNSYDGVKSDVEIARSIKMLSSQVRYLRLKLGLPTVSYDSRRVLLGKPSIVALDEQEIKQAIIKRITYNELALKYGVRPSTIKDVFKKSGLDRSALAYHPVEISDRVSEIMIGHILGDGCVIPISKGRAAYFKVGHKIADKEYTEWSANELICLKPVLRKQTKFMDGRAFEFLSYTSVKTSTLVGWHKKFYDSSLRKKYGTDGCKKPDLKIFEQLSDLSLAIWYMDDGTYDDGYPAIATYFPGLDYNLMCETLTKRFGIKFYTKKRKQIRLLCVRGASNRNRFFSIVKPYIHPRMARKLTPLDRGISVYSDDTLSTQFPTSIYRESNEIEKNNFIDKLINHIIEFPIQIRKIDQPLNEYLGDLQEKLSKCIPKDGQLSYLQDGLTYLDTICQHRFTANHNKQLSFFNAIKSPLVLRKSVISLLDSNQGITQKNVYRRIMELISAPGHFRPSGAASLINLYKPSSILDPFAGWCGRALACALNKHIQHYVGVDLQEPTVNAIRKILEDTQPFGVGRMQAIHGDALEYMKNTDLCFDMVLAGPPYYNVENYNGVTQSGTFSDWLKEFVEPFCALIPKVLSTNGIFALHIFDTHQYSFIEPFMFALKQNGLTHKDQFKFGFLKHSKRSQFIHIFSKE